MFYLFKIANYVEERVIRPLMLPLPNNRMILVILFCASLFLFTRNLSVHGLEYRDDEIFYYHSTQQMLEINEYLSPVYFGENRFQKPILFYWIIFLGYKLFGINWFGARIFSCIFASLTVCLTWSLGSKMFNRQTAFLSSIILMTCVMFLRHAKNAVPDMALNFFIVLALYIVFKYFLEFTTMPREDQGTSLHKFWPLFFSACALGFMIKGFASVIVPIVTFVIFGFFMRRKGLLKNFGFLKGLGCFLIIVMPWFIYMINRHGQNYLEYMVIDETKNRLLTDQTENILGHQFINIGKHMLFYIQTIFSYFAPWSIFWFLAIITIFFRLKNENEKKPSIIFLLCWIFVVFGFFSFMNFTINHYMLVLTTPFAVLTSEFILNEECNTFVRKIFRPIKIYLPVIFILFGSFAFIFLTVFLIGANIIWALLLAAFSFAIVVFVVQKRSPAISTLTLGLFLFVIFSQSSMMEKARVTPHVVWQNFADTITSLSNSRSVISVGSRDVHEKEFQAHMDKKVVKIEAHNDQLTKNKLAEFFHANEDIFCVITEGDYFKYGLDEWPAKPVIIKTDFIFRKRMYIDKGFFIALLSLDQAGVHDYLMEKILLVRKG